MKAFPSKARAKLTIKVCTVYRLPFLLLADHHVVLTGIYFPIERQQ